MRKRGKSPKPLTVLFEHTVPKHEDTPNEDKWRRSEDGNILALSDGATISFDAERWAQTLVEAFVADPVLTADWISAARESFAAAYDREELPWNMQAALDRGSSATLLGLTFSPDGCRAELTAIGDSVAVVVHDGDWLTSFPYEKSEQFESTPVLLSSNPAEGLNVATDPPSPQPIYLAEHPGKLHFLLMTDALGAWCLSNREENVLRLLAFKKPSDFEEFVTAERANGSLKRDDTTLIILGCSK
jgi:hypothetical protein